VFDALRGFPHVDVSGRRCDFQQLGVPSLAVVRNGVARRFPAVMLVISLSATRSKIVTIKVRTLDAHQKLPFPAGSDAQARWAHRGATQVWNTPETYQLTCTRIRT